MWVKKLGRVFQWVWWITGSLVITVLLVFALLLNIARIATPWLNKHPQFVMRQIDSVWPGHIQFKTMHWSWSWMSPQVVLANVSIEAPNVDQTFPEVLNAQQMRLSLNLWQTILHMHLHLNAVDITGTDIIVRQERDGYVINGFFIPKHHSQKPLTLEGLLQDFGKIKVNTIDLRNIGVQLYLLQHAPIHIRVPGLAVKHLGQQFLVHGEMSVTPDHVQHLKFWLKQNMVSHLASACLQFVNLHIEHINQWSSMLPLLKRLSPNMQPMLRFDGVLNGTVWLDLNRQHVMKMQSQMSLSHAFLEHRGPLKTQNIGSLTANMAFVRSHLHWDFIADHIHGSWQNQSHALGSFLIAYHGGALANRQWQFTANHLWLGFLSHPIWQTLLGSTHLGKILVPLKPEGSLPFLRVSLSGVALHHIKHPDFKVDAFFDHVAWKANHAIPGVSNLNGAIIGDMQQGNIYLRQGFGLLNFQKIFKTPWIVKKTQVQAKWHYTPSTHDWLVDIEKLGFDDGHMFAQVTGTLKGTGLHAPKGDLEGDFHLNDVGLLGRYLPKIKLKPKVYDWLADSFTEGFINHGEFILRGPVNKFPFRQKEGDFLATGDVHQVHMKYGEGWPALNQLNGHLTFHDNAMFMQHGTANLPHVLLQNIHGSIPYLNHADVDLSANMQGDVQGIGQFFLNSPLGVKQVFEDLHGSGAFTGDLHLNLPVNDLSGGTKVDGHASIKDVDWDAPAWDTKMTHSHGTFHFTQTGIRSDDLQGLIFNAPTAIQIKPFTQKGLKNPATSVHLQGDFPLPVVMQTYVPSLAPFVKGHTPINMALKVYDSDEHKNDSLTIDSNLQGAVVTQLPDGLSKTAATTRKYHLFMDIGLQKTVIDSFYGNLAKSRTILMASPQGETVTAEQVALGNTPLPYQPSKNGLAIAMNEPTSDLDKWYQIYENYIMHPDNPVKSNLVLHYLSAQIDHASMFHQNLTGIHFELRKANDEWDWRVASSRVNGEGNLPITSTIIPWEINLKYAHLRKVVIPKTKASALPLTVADFPPMHVRIQDFSYQENYLHALNFHLAHTNDDQMAITGLYMGDEAMHAAMSIDGMGLTTDTPVWHIKGAVRGNDFGEGLKEFHLPAHLTNTHGTIKIDAFMHQKWPVGKWKAIVKTIDASLSVSLANGSIVGFSQSVQNTLATLKVLNSLSILSLPEKLAGKNKRGTLFFTNLSGTASLHNLHWQVPQITMKSSEINVVGSGYGDLSDKSVDFWVSVQPHLTGSVPVLAALAGGPVVGIASWLVNKLVVGPAVSHAAAKTFHMTGHWPKVKVNVESATSAAAALSR